MRFSQDLIITIALICLIVGLQRRSTYQIMTPTVHELGTEDDLIPLVGGRPVSDSITEKVVYEFLETLAKVKGHNDVAMLLDVEFQGKTIQDVYSLMKNVNVGQFVATLNALDPEQPEDIDLFEKEIILNEDDIIG